MNNYENAELLNGQIDDHHSKLLWVEVSNIPLKWSTFEDESSSGCRVIESDMFENISIWEVCVILKRTLIHIFQICVTIMHIILVLVW
jgi:hypothetical protein